MPASGGELQRWLRLAFETTPLFNRYSAAATQPTIRGFTPRKSLHSLEVHVGIRWRAAEMVATCVQNNPPVQQVRCYNV